MVAFQFYLQSGISMMGGEDSDVVFGQNFPGEKGNVIQCIVVMLEPVLF
jgi:hypothetical protein